MKSIQKLHYFTYIVMLILTVVLAIASVVAAALGDISLFTGGLAAIVFIVFAILQIICLAVYQPGFTPYKIGFYLMHIGLLILLAGLAAFELAGNDMTVQVPVSESGAYYDNIKNENGDTIDLGYAFKITDFTVEKYPSGADKYYRADVAFTDPTTLAVNNDYLEVNRTLRQNGWKMYLMDYNDGLKTLSGQYGLTPESFYASYTAKGATSGVDLLGQIYGDMVGTRYSYLLYDEQNSYFTSLSKEQVSLLTGSLWSYVTVEDGLTTVYITRKDGSFKETLTTTGNELISHVQTTYPEARVAYYYYTIDRGVVTWLYDESVAETTTNPIATYGEVFAGIRENGEGNLAVYVMARELKPTHTFTSTEGGSTMLAQITETCGGESAEVSYMLYNAKANGFALASEEQIAALDGRITGYALNMGDGALVYVQPLSVVLLIKHDPGEFATIIGMVTVMLGAVLMCLVRGKKTAPADEPAAPTSKSAKPTQSATPSKKNKGGKK
ncbi:MAG: cytochrome c biogenesis protein ResB [Clostridia bacterium]|nr:cytochrome c biogenesis protein ResB [Clostridia bacterium]